MPSLMNQTENENKLDLCQHFFHFILNELSFQVPKNGFYHRHV